MNIQILLFSAVVIGMAASNEVKEEHYLPYCRTSELYNSTIKDCSVEVIGQTAANMTVLELQEHYKWKDLNNSEKEDFINCAEKRVKFSYFGNATAEDIDHMLALLEVDKEEILQELKIAAKKCIDEKEGECEKVLKCIIKVAKQICK